MNRPRRDRQLTVQFTNEEVAELERIAQIEERDRAYLVAWFARWGMMQYWDAGSLVQLRNSRPESERGLHLPAKDRERFFSTTTTEGDADDGRKDESPNVSRKHPKFGAR